MYIDHNGDEAVYKLRKATVVVYEMVRGYFPT